MARVTCCWCSFLITKGIFLLFCQERMFFISITAHNEVASSRSQCELCIWLRGISYIPGDAEHGSTYDSNGNRKHQEVSREE